MDTIGERLKILRNDKKLTLQQLADLIGTHKGNLSSYESNKYEPSAQTVIMLSNIFGVTTDWILKGVEGEDLNVQISQQERCLLKDFRELTPRDQKEIVAIIDMKLDAYDDFTGKSSPWQHGNNGTGGNNDSGIA